MKLWAILGETTVNFRSNGRFFPQSDKFYNNNSLVVVL